MINPINWERKTKWQREVFEYFGESCAFTGRTDNMTLDHLIPRQKAYGEVTNQTNLLPLCLSVNSSKNNSHVFEWFDQKGKQHGVSEERFTFAIEYIANKLGMSFEEYREYYDSMYFRDNKKDLPESEEDEQRVLDFRKSKFVMIPRTLADDTKATPREKVIYITLCLYANNNSKQAFPSINTIADKSGYSRSSAIRGLNALEALGYIRKENRFVEDSKQTSNVYILLDVD